ncbi:MAG: hypothetical protein APF84_13835 [Gracilibacter sp. BRH_c7a]|nr:MAG: hypothetical protein APF84_13835 [Gracilibacter sp. BRH_c7a]
MELLIALIAAIVVTIPTVIHITKVSSKHNLILGFGYLPKSLKKPPQLYLISLPVFIFVFLVIYGIGLIIANR